MKLSQNAPAAMNTVPVIAVTKTVPVTTGQGARKSTNYAPVMAIEGWIKRPEGMTADAEAADDDIPFDNAPAGHVPPPAKTNGAAPHADVEF